MSGRRRDQEDLRMALAVVCGRFLLGAGAGVLAWGFLVGQYLGPDWLFTGRCFLCVVFVCGLLGVLLPTTEVLARAVLRRLPFFSRYDWF